MKKRFCRIQLAILKQHIVHVRGKDVIVTQKCMLLDKGQDGLAIFAPLRVVEEGTCLQQGGAGFECFIHRIVAAWMYELCLPLMDAYGTKRCHSLINYDYMSNVEL